MNLIRETSDFFKISSLRFKGLRSEIKILLILSIISILSIEFILNKFQPFWNFQYDFGVVYLKLCYSYFSAFLFYYLIVYAPRERRRVKTFRYLNNKILGINSIVSDILVALFRKTDPETTNLKPDIIKDDIIRMCKLINPQLPVELSQTQFATFRNHYEFLNLQTERIKLLIGELIILNDVLDENVIRGLTNINDIITSRLSFDTGIPGKMDMEYLSHALYDLYFENDELTNYFLENFRKRYNYEYHKHERIRNQKRK